VEQIYPPFIRNLQTVGRINENVYQEPGRSEQKEDDMLLNMFLWELDLDILFAAIMQRRVYEPQRSSQKENNARAVYEQQQGRVYYTFLSHVILGHGGILQNPPRRTTVRTKIFNNVIC
jgi:hypothetical protein